MLKFEIDVAASDKESRTITGLAVPFNTSAELSGQLYSFKPGSLRKGRAVTPLLLDHSTDRPVGVLADLSDGEAGAIATFKVDNTPDGDAALATAASGSRGGLSVGVNVVAAEDSDGVQLVSHANLMEISLCAIPAFADAQVQTVTASENPPENESAKEVEVQHETAAPLAAEIEEPVAVVAAAPKPKVAKPSLGEYVAASVQAQRGDRRGAELLAALDEDLTPDVPGLLLAYYESQILDQTTVQRTLYNVFRHRPIPAEGKEIVAPREDPILGFSGWRQWDASAPSQKMTVGTKTTPVNPWSYGLAVHQDVQNRATIDFLSYAYGRMGDQYNGNVEQQIADAIAAAATAAATWEAAVEAVWEGGRPYGLTPTHVLATPEFHGKLLVAKGEMTYSDGSAAARPYGASLAGLPVVVSPLLDQNYVVSSAAITYAESAGFRLSAANVSALELEIALTRYTAMMIGPNPQVADTNGANPGDAGYVPTYDDTKSVVMAGFATPASMADAVKASSKKA